MEVKGLDGKAHKWNLAGHIPDITREKSSYHELAREVLKGAFPCVTILEELPLPGSGGLIADFFLPQYKMIVEVHGIQHYRFVPHFHGTVIGFNASRRRDKIKIEWCDLNNLIFVELPYYEEISQWKSRLNGALLSC